MLWRLLSPRSHISPHDHHTPSSGRGRMRGDEEARRPRDRPHDETRYSLSEYGIDHTVQFVLAPDAQIWSEHADGEYIYMYIACVCLREEGGHFHVSWHRMGLQQGVDDGHKLALQAKNCRQTRQPKWRNGKGLKQRDEYVYVKLTHRSDDAAVGGVSSVKAGSAPAGSSGGRCHEGGGPARLLRGSATGTHRERRGAAEAWRAGLTGKTERGGVGVSEKRHK